MGRTQRTVEITLIIAEAVAGRSILVLHTARFGRALGRL
jgi:hypothetical protein